MLGNIWRRAFPSIQTPGPGSPDKNTASSRTSLAGPAQGAAAAPPLPRSPAVTELPSLHSKRLAGDSCQGRGTTPPTSCILQGLLLFSCAARDKQVGERLCELPLVYFSSELQDNFMGLSWKPLVKQLCARAGRKGKMQGDQQEAQSTCPTSRRLGLCAYIHLMFNPATPAVQLLRMWTFPLHPHLQECLPALASGESRNQVKKT